MIGMPVFGDSDMSRELIERYKRLYAGVIYDALYFDLAYHKPFVVHRSIGYLAGSAADKNPLVGPAFTRFGRSTDDADTTAIELLDTFRLEMLEAIRPGDVLVIDTCGDESVAHFGDVSALLAAKAGAVGGVIDGYTRDVSLIDAMEFPLFAKGVQPVDAYGRWFLTRYTGCVRLPGHGGSRIVVNPGDLIFADRDGVLLIPQRLAADILEAAEKRAKREDNIREAILAGDSPADIYQRLGRW